MRAVAAIPGRGVDCTDQAAAEDSAATAGANLPILRRHDSSIYLDISNPILARPVRLGI